MKFKLALGTGVAIVAVYCVVVVGFVRRAVYYESYHRHTGIVIRVIGATLLAVGTWKRRQRAQPPTTEDGTPMEESVEPADAPHRVSFFDARYGGLMAMILGVATVFIIPLPPTPKSLPVHASEPPPRPGPKPGTVAKPAPTNEPMPVVTPAKPTKFPKLQLQGVIFKPDRPSALINGKTYFIGDMVQEAKVIDIGRDYVLLDVDGRHEALLLKP